MGQAVAARAIRLLVRSTSYRSTCTSREGPGQALRPDSPHFLQGLAGSLERAPGPGTCGQSCLCHHWGPDGGSYGAVPVDAVPQVMKLACARSSCRWKRERIFHGPFEWLMPAAACNTGRTRRKRRLARSLAAVPLGGAARMPHGGKTLRRRGLEMEAD